MTKSKSESRRRHLLPLALFVLVSVGAAYLLRDQLSYDSLAENRDTLIDMRDSHYIGAVAIFVAVYAVIVTLSIPGATVATLAGGFVFGLFPGVIYNVAAASIGAMALFVAAKWGLGDWLAGRMDQSEGRVHAVKAAIDHNQWSALFLLRLLPIVPFFVANLLPALFGASFYRFAVSTVLGIIPGTAIYTSVGAGLGTVFEGGEAPDLGVIFEPRILLPLLGLAALALLPMVLQGKHVRTELKSGSDQD